MDSSHRKRRTRNNLLGGPVLPLDEVLGLAAADPLLGDGLGGVDVLVLAPVFVVHAESENAKS